MFVPDDPTDETGVNPPSDGGIVHCIS